MKQYIIIIAGLLWGLAELRAQSLSDSLNKPLATQYRRITGLNMTPLVTQLVPFNRADPNAAGPFLLRFKRYGARNKTAFRLSMGLHLTPDDNDEFDDLQLSLAFGWEKRRSINRHWGYTRGFDIMLLGGDLNIPGNTNTESAIIAVGPLWGVEYFFAQRMSIGVEAVLALGFSPASEIIVIDILPPVGIFLNHYF